MFFIRALPPLFPPPLLVALHESYYFFVVDLPVDNNDLDYEWNLKYVEAV